MIEVRDLCKKYQIKKSNCKTVFEEINFEISKGEFVSVRGRSGAGKSTLLHILGGLECQTSGEYYFEGKPLPKKGQATAEFRNKNIGFIVQSHALIDEWNIFDNISLPLRYRGCGKNEIYTRVQQIAAELGILNLLKQYPYLLSGGEKQRAAIARAIIGNPPVLLADEPTASLDEDNKRNVVAILKELNRQGMTVVVASHDKEIYQCGDKEIRIGS